MPISNSYPKGIPIEDQDLFVGTKAYNNRTVNYTAQGVADYLSINSKVAIGGQMSFQFTIVPNIPKTIAFEGGLGDNTAFSAITKLIVSAIDVSTANITIFLNYLNNSQILLSQQNQPNFFGHYKIIGYTQIGTSAFYELDLEFIGGNGTIIDKQYYDLVSFVLSTSGSATVWGDIIGDIEDQTDLINYISSQITIPTLQEVTDNGGNTTSNTIQVGGITSGNFSSDGFGVYISDSYDTTYNFNYIPFVGLQIGDGLSQYVTLGNDGRIEFVNSAGGVGVLRSNLLTGYVEWELPDAYGTIALTSDIPTLIEGSGIDIDYTDPLNIIISATGGGSPTGPAGGDLSATYPNPSVVWNNGKSTYDLVYYPLISNPAGYLTAAAAALTYYPIPTGTISQYIRGDGSLATFPSATIPTLQQVVTAGPTITTAFTHASTSFENTFNDVGIAINNFIDNSAIYYQGNGIIHTKIGLTQRLVFGPFDGLAPTSRAITIPNADGTIALTSDIPTLVEGSGIDIDYTDPLNPIISATGGGGGVPYTGATQNVDLGEFGLKAGQLTLDTTPTGTAVVTTTRWNDTIGSSETTLKGGNVILKNGVDLVARIVNKVTPNTTLTKAAYQVVRISGAQGQRLAVDLARANSDLNSADTLGVVTETITTNQEGFILTVGQLEGINTTGSLQGETWADGDVLYLSPTTAGRMTNIKPNGSNGHIVVIGYVEHAHNTQGKIYVKIMNGWELDELHNVFIDTPLNNQGLVYETSTDLWKNKTIIEDSITNGVTAIAPSQNAVFDALALKQAVLSYTPYKNIQTSQTVHTGTTAETNIFTATIPGGVYNSNDVIKVLFGINKTTLLAGYILRLRLSTTNNPLGGTLIAYFSGGTGVQSAIMTRNFSLNGGNLYGVSFPTTIITDQVATNVLSSTTLNPANQFFIHANISLVNTGDSIIGTMLSIHN